MRDRIGGLSVAVVLLGCLVAPACARRSAPGDPVRGLTRGQQEQFDKGRLVFTREFTPETGLGPLFNAVSCGECHEDPAPGGTGDESEVHVAAFHPAVQGAGGRGSGSCDLLEAHGGPIIQQHVTPALKAALGIDEEPEPPGATGRGRRTTPDILGFGLLDAVPDAEILSRADPDDRDGDGISGRPNYAPDGRIGRFGRKALVPTLREFNAGAFLNEQGITTPEPMTGEEGTVAGKPLPAGVDPLPEPELSRADFELADAFVRFLAPPAAARLSGSARRGERLFSEIKCAACHAPRLITGDNPVRALARRPVAAYTDLLLHDMGPDMADICFGIATPSEFRTEPLMGLHLATRFLHDGRADSIEEAIRLHAGEAKMSRDRFAALPEGERKALLEFLGAL
jgi:CxxC motif-containing protein (DUF1111 family)